MDPQEAFDKSTEKLENALLSNQVGLNHSFNTKDLSTIESSGHISTYSLWFKNTTLPAADRYAAIASFDRAIEHWSEKY